MSHKLMTPLYDRAKATPLNSRSIPDQIALEEDAAKIQTAYESAFNKAAQNQAGNIRRDIQSFKELEEIGEASRRLTLQKKQKTQAGYKP